MMSPVRQFETTYATIRQKLMTGYWLPGFQLVTPHLANELDVSLSPVRDSLSYLAGQHMVDFIPTAGFFVPWIDEAQFRDLLDLHRTLLHAATAAGDPLPWPGTLAQDYAARSAAMFEHVAAWSGNTALVQAVRNLSDRLHTFRQLDPIVLPKAAEDIDAMENTLIKATPVRVVRDLLTHYHSVRKRQAGHYVRLRAAGGSPSSRIAP